MAKKYRLMQVQAFLILLWILGAAFGVSASETLIIESDGPPLTLVVEVADTADARNKGLMFRKELAPFSGMLFDFGRTGPVAMWMKNTLIPLDMIFTDRQGKILYIHENARPEDLTTIQPPMPVYAVLEVIGGFVETHGVHIGDRLVYSLFSQHNLNDAE
ncbi:MAG: DUF192 domain-containing protein [Sneathiella sp.]